MSLIKQVLTLWILINITAVSLLAQPKVTEIGKSQIPRNISFIGEPVDCFKWVDRLGTNYLIRTLTKEYRPKEAIEARKHFKVTKYEDYLDTMYESYTAEFINRELIAYHFVVINRKTNQLWKLEDEVHQCADAMTLEYLGKPLITDLNGDNISEVWLVYTLGCRSDVSPVDMKVLMYEGSKKYGIRGTRFIRYGEPEETAGGDKKMDKEFMSLPDKLRKFGLRLWNKFREEHLE